MPSRTLYLAAPGPARRFRPAAGPGCGAIRWALPLGTAHLADAPSGPAASSARREDFTSPAAPQDSTAATAAPERAPDADRRDGWADTAPQAQAGRRARRARRLRIAALVLAVWAIAACIGLTIAVCRLSIRLARLEAIAAAGAERPEIPSPRTDSADAGPGATDGEAAPTQRPSDSGGDVYSAPAVPAFPSRLVRAG